MRTRSAALYTRAAKTLAASPEVPTNGVARLAQGCLAEEQGEEERALTAYRAALTDPGLPADLRHEARRRLARLYKRRGAWEEALALWRQAAAQGQLDAFEELAKYYEHQARDPREALRWTEAALALLQAPGYWAERLRWEKAFRHRQARLRGKVGRE